MRHLIPLALLLLAAGPALAQAGGNLAPGRIVDGAKTGLDGEGRQAATTGDKMVKQGDSGARAPAKAETPNKP